jgi:nucleoside-diphosphate-sugar epimerase
MKAFMTGATGFIGGRLAHRLRERGDEVVCLVRNPDKAADLKKAGCTIVEGDLRDQAAIRKAMEGAEVVYHVAADYRIGIKADKIPELEDANVGGTQRVLDAAVDAGARRILYVSTAAAFGNTRGEVVDETREHPGDSYTSTYERTKVEAHRLAVERAREGAPVIIVQPTSVYGKGDRSVTGQIIADAARGKLPAVSFPKMGLTMVHVDDVVDGIIAAVEKGKPGESYILGGDRTTMRELVDTAAKVAGRKPPKLNMPTPLIKSMIPVAPLATKAMGLPPNLKELISSSDGVTFWTRHDKAERELGYRPRDLETGLKQTVG